MTIKLPVPRHSYDGLRKCADEFLRQYNPQDIVPVPIEEIAEAALGLNIIPIPGLQRTFEVDGFISNDLTSITVDQFILEERISRYRFTLAHEIAHLYLHREIFEQQRFTSIDEWKNFQSEVDAEDYGWLEWQAYAFAGLVLVPFNHLAEHFRICAQQAQNDGFSSGSEAFAWYIAEMLAGTFEVSHNVIEKRLAKDNLLKADV